MAKTNTDLDWLTSKLQSTTLPKESGVSFAGKGLKLNEAEDAQAIVDQINKAEKVEFLNMEGNSLGVAAAEEIGKALASKKEFRKALWKDMFTSRLKNEIPIALKHLANGLMSAGAKLEILDLSDNASGPIGVEGFEELLRSPSCYTLRELRLNNMGLGVTGAKKLASALLDLYNNSKIAGEPLKLEVFVAGRNRLENPGATALAKVFEKIGTLKEISIPQNGIYHLGVAALSSAFDENLSLEVINLNDNTVTQKGAKSLSKVLCKLSSLKSLDLGDCLLRSEGATAIAMSLTSLCHLETLNLSFNEIKSNVGLKVLNSLVTISSLTLINLDGNMFGPQNSEQLLSLAEELNLPLGSLDEDEGEDGDHEDYEQVDEEEEEDDEDGDEEEEEDAEDTESDQPYNIGKGKEKVLNKSEDSNVKEVSLVTSLLETLSLSKLDETAKPERSEYMEAENNLVNLNCEKDSAAEVPLINLKSPETKLNAEANKFFDAQTPDKFSIIQNEIGLKMNDSDNGFSVEILNKLNKGDEIQKEIERNVNGISSNVYIENLIDVNLQEDINSLSTSKSDLERESLLPSGNLIDKTQGEKSEYQMDQNERNKCRSIIEQYKTILPLRSACEIVSTSYESVSFQHGFDNVKPNEPLLDKQNEIDNKEGELQSTIELKDSSSESNAKHLNKEASSEIHSNDKSSPENADSSKCTIL